MPKVSRQTAAKGGLMTAILGMIGNVVGIGIFFKNNTVFRLNNQNAIGVIVAWAISTLIVLFMAISFAEIASAKTKTGKAGIGPWAQTFCGHRFGRYSKLGYALIFWPINTFAVMFFAGEAILNCFAPLLDTTTWGSVSGYDYGRGTTSYIFLIGAVLFAAFMVVNYFKFKSMAKVGKGISFVKFAPIAMVVLIGIIFGALCGGGLWTKTTAAAVVDTQAVDAAKNAASSFSFIGAISCIPAILFSFEGYVAIDSFKNDLSNPDKQIPLGVVIGVVVIAVLYFAVTIGCITAGTGDVYSLVKDIFFAYGGKYYNPVAYKVLTTLISVFIFICLLGCVNGMARGGITTYQELCQENAVFKGKALADLKPGNQYFAGTIWFSIIVGIWFIILLIPSAIWNTDAIADGSSTSMIVMLYVIYGALVLCAFMNRFKKHNQIEVKKNKIFPVAAVIGLIGCLFMIGYVAFYQFLYAPIAGGWNNLNSDCAAKAGWGMFVTCAGQHAMTNGDIIIWFWVMTAIAALSPVINDALINWFDKSNKNLLMWQSDKVAVRTITGATVAVAKKPEVKVVKVQKPVKIEKAKPAKVEKPVVAKQPKVAKPHPYRPIWISILVTLVVIGGITMAITMLA